MPAIHKHWVTRVVLLLVCGMGIGFTLQTIATTRAHESNALHKGETKPSTLTIEEQFAAALKHRDEEKQKQASRAIFASLGVKEITSLVAQVEKFTEELSESDGGYGGWILCNEFYSRWGELAPVAALEFLKDHESYWGGQIESVWTAWARTDPDGFPQFLSRPRQESRRIHELPTHTSITMKRFASRWGAMALEDEFRGLRVGTR